MKVVIYCRDKAGHTALRIENRAAHLAYAKQINDRILCGGPLLSPDGTEMIGSLLVIEFDSLQAAQDWAKNDPYAQAGLFESVEITPWRQGLPVENVGG